MDWKHRNRRWRLVAKRANVLEAVAENGGASLNGKVAELDAEIGTVDQRIAAAEAERAQLAGTTIDEAELRRMLVGFDEIWAALTVAERARVLALLIDRIEFNGPTGDVEITFRSCEP